MTTTINGSSPSITFSDSTTQTTAFTTTPIITAINTGSATPLTFSINGTEAGRFDANGNLLVGKTSGLGYRAEFQSTNLTTLYVNRATSTGNLVDFAYAGTINGTISTNGTNVTYGTSSDYRLKENVAPMTGALETVAQLKPVTYDWISDKTKGQGFIAHELQAVVPDCVTGEKDAVDAEGNPKYQGIDTSFLVATLTAAIQELNAKVTALEAQLGAK